MQPPAGACGGISLDLDLRGNCGAARGRAPLWRGGWLVGTDAGDLGLPTPPFPLAQEWPTHPRQAAASFVGRAPRATSVRAMGRLALRSVTAGLLAVSAAAADDLVFSPPVLIEATPGSELHADGFAAVEVDRSGESTLLYGPDHWTSYDSGRRAGSAISER